MNKISIIIALYNGKKFITEQITSILNQTIIPHEIIIVDDCSCDESNAIILNLFSSNESYRNGNLQLRIIRNEINIGSTKSFLKGIGHSNGTHLFLSDQDDIWEKNKIERMVKRSEELNPNKPGLLWSDLMLMNYQGIPLFKTYREEWKIGDTTTNFNKSLFYNTIPGCSMMINSEMKKVLNQFIQDPIFKYHDHLITLLASLNNNIILESTPLIKWRIHENQSTQKLKLTILSNLKQLLKKNKSIEESLINIEKFQRVFDEHLNESQKEIIQFILGYKDSNYFFKYYMFYKTIYMF